MTPSLIKKPTASLTALVLIALALLCLLAFHRLLGADFLPWDDDIAVTTNPHLQLLSSQNLYWMFTDTHRTLRYEPLTFLVWACVYAATGFAPHAFHLLNLLLHIANTLLAFFLIRDLLRWLPLPQVTPRRLSLVAALAAALWSVHPLRVEVVGWVTQACFAECTCLALATLLLYSHAVRRRPDRPSRTPAFWASVATFAGSLLFFSASIGIAALLPFLDILLFRRVPPGSATFRNLVKFFREKGAFLLIAIVIGILTIHGRAHAAAGTWAPPPTLAEFPFFPRIMQAAYIVIYYLWKPFDPLHLSPVYTTLFHFDPLAAPFVLSLLACLLLSAASLLAWRRHPLLAACWITHLLLIFPFGGYFDHPHYPSDRYAYLQGLLLSLLFAVLFLQFLARAQARLRPLFFPLAVAIVMLCTGLSIRYSRAWNNGESFFLAILSDLGNDPYRFQIDWRLGKYYADHRDFAKALQCYDRVIRYASNYPVPFYLKGMALLQLADIARQQHRPPAAIIPIYQQAESLLDHAVSVAPSTPYLIAAGDAYFQAGDMPAARSRYQAALTFAPSNAALEQKIAATLVPPSAALPQK